MAFSRRRGSRHAALAKLMGIEKVRPSRRGSVRPVTQCPLAAMADYLRWVGSVIAPGDRMLDQSRGASDQALT